MAPVVLSHDHQTAVNRSRRIILEYDAHDPSELLGGDFDRWLEFRFQFADQPGSQIDAIMWDLHPSSDVVAYPSDLLPSPHLESLQRWHQQGIDWLQRVIVETHVRGLEAWWTHRISEVELSPSGILEMERLSPLKAEHPDWTVSCWWWQGMWNLAAPGLRAHKTALLRELAERYDLDGIQINFARHLPVLPVGRQWELREGPTDLMRQVRTAMQQVAEARGRPIMLAAKVPETIAGCRTDGLDVATWVREGLVDLLTLGSRTFTMDIPAFRRDIGFNNVKLCPCYDDHHASDAYRHAPIEVLRGVFGNWLAQGADGVETFNWSNAPEGYYSAHGIPNTAVNVAHELAYQEVGSLDTLRGGDMTFIVERRGVFPWSEGYFCRNEHFELPLVLANDGRLSAVHLRIDVDVTAATSVQLSILVYNMQPADRVSAAFNGTEVVFAGRDDSYKDPQIFSPRPQPPAGVGRSVARDREQQLTLLQYRLNGDAIHAGINNIHLAIASRGSFSIGADLKVEKVELACRFS